MDLQVAPNLASFGAPTVKLQVAPRLAPPVAPSDEVPGCPGTCIFRPCRRWIFRLPRISRPSALLAINPRVAPILHASSCACRCVPGLPRRLHLPALPAMESRVSPNLASFSGLQWSETTGRPATWLLQYRLPVSLRVAPHSNTFRLCLGSWSPQVAPHSRSLGAG